MRPDHKIILDFVKVNSSVLDLGCGNGELLALLEKEKNARGQGIEIDEQAVYDCVANGVNVIHGDIDTGLSEYSDNSFDYVILNQSLQQIKHLDVVFTDALRVGRNVIVGFPNFAYYKSRLQLFFKGRAPVTNSLPYSWHDTPNIHFFSISDFLDYCHAKNLNIKSAAYIGAKLRVFLLPNIFANLGLFLISK